MYKSILLVVIIALVNVFAFSQSFRTFSTGTVNVEIPRNWKVQSYQALYIELIRDADHADTDRLYIAAISIEQEQDFQQYLHAQLIPWLKSSFQLSEVRLSQVNVVNERHKQEITLGLFNGGEHSKAKYRAEFIPGKGFVMCLYILQSGTYFSDYHGHILDRTFSSMYRAANAIQNATANLQTSPTKETLVGTWFYGNSLRVKHYSPGYASDIVIESTTGMDRAGITYIFNQDNSYRLVYKGVSAGSFGRIEMNMVESGTYSLQGGEITFSPSEYRGHSSFNQDRRKYHKTSGIPVRHGLIQYTADGKIQIKEPCAELMAETWCDSGKLYFVDYKKIAQ